MIFSSSGGSSLRSSTESMGPSQVFKKWHGHHDSVDFNKPQQKDENMDTDPSDQKSALIQPQDKSLFEMGAPYTKENDIFLNQDGEIQESSNRNLLKLDCHMDNEESHLDQTKRVLFSIPPPLESISLDLSDLNIFGSNLNDGPQSTKEFSEVSILNLKSGSFNGLEDQSLEMRDNDLSYFTPEEMKGDSNIAKSLASINSKDTQNNQGPFKQKMWSKGKYGEHWLFLEGLERFGKNWKEIQAYIKTRSCQQTRSHAQKFFRKMQRRGVLKVNLGGLTEENELILKTKFDQEIIDGSQKKRRKKRKNKGKKQGEVVSEEDLKDIKEFEVKVAIKLNHMYPQMAISTSQIPSLLRRNFSVKGDNSDLDFCHSKDNLSPQELALSLGTEPSLSSIAASLRSASIKKGPSLHNQAQKLQDFRQHSKFQKLFLIEPQPLSNEQGPVSSLSQPGSHQQEERKRKGQDITLRGKLNEERKTSEKSKNKQFLGSSKTISTSDPASNRENQESDFPDRITLKNTPDSKSLMGLQKVHQPKYKNTKRDFKQNALQVSREALKEQDVLFKQDERNLKDRLYSQDLDLYEQGKAFASSSYQLYDAHQILSQDRSQHFGFFTNYSSSTALEGKPSMNQHLDTILMKLLPDEDLQWFQ